ncbi:uncharacterized protein LOC121858586 [Homarus americanus]|uniref:uncharacterized protein LOC121858586 n=1 Tax=Homarus americanus TaxID=6706 RepID=UPI001C47ED0A|nr:uncharacterized protein LOC121858586 [Homarus americanus]XP_042211011.1 uncharacterized protein LOC121858586 [Homarus americanus]
MQFEKISKSFQCPEESWIAMLQRVFTGSARSAFLSLSNEVFRIYKLVKEEILKAYELIPETYRVKFRTMRKTDVQSYIEFVYSLSKMCRRWIKSGKVETFEELVELMILEQFKRATPRDIQLYLGERDISNVHKAAALADSYALTHKMHPVKSQNHSGGKGFVTKEKGGRQDSSITSSSKVNFRGNSGELSKTYAKTKSFVCFYCKKPGHVIANYPKLEAKKEEPVLSFEPLEKFDKTLVRNRPKEDSFEPFMFEGSVAVEESDDQYPAKILRNTGASHSILLKGSVPCVEDSYTGEHLVLKGVIGVITSFV